MILRVEGAVTAVHIHCQILHRVVLHTHVGKTRIVGQIQAFQRVVIEIDQNIINQEAMYDGLYAVCTNLEDPVEEIVKVNHSRWEIEESFRIMKSEFMVRPVFHRKEDMIKAHFTTCFLALIVYRYLEKELNEKYTVTEIIDTLKEMNMKLENKNSYIPNYTRTDLTDDLHDKFGFRTDYEVMDIKKFKKIFNQIKK